MATDPNRRWPVLVVSGRPNRVSMDLVGRYERDEHGRQLLDNLEFAPQANDLAQASAALGAQFIYPGGTHIGAFRLVMIDGDIAFRIGKRELEGLRRSIMPANEQLNAIFLGMADTADERKRFLDLGIVEIIEPQASPQSAWHVIGGAANKMREEIRARAAAELEARAPKRVSLGAAPEGSLPNGGIITVHSTKGGVGKSTVAANIAWALAGAGAPTMLIDLNPDGAHLHQEFWEYLKKDYATTADLFAERGLTALGSRMDLRSQRSVNIADVAESAVTIVPNYLWLVPGMSDQSDYRSNSATHQQMLSNDAWIKDMIESLDSVTSNFAYIVIDAGTNRYTSLGKSALRVVGNRTGLLVLVLDMSSPAAIEDEYSAMATIYDRDDVGAALKIHGGKHLIVANKVSDLPGAPKVAETAKTFEFFGADQVVPVRQDMQSALYSQSRRRPILSIERGLPPTATLYGDMQKVANAIRRMYEVDGAKKKTFNPFKRGG